MTLYQNLETETFGSYKKVSDTKEHISDVFSIDYCEFPSNPKLGTETFGPHEQIYDVLLIYFYEWPQNHTMDNQTFASNAQTPDGLPGDHF